MVKNSAKSSRKRLDLPKCAPMVIDVSSLKTKAKNTVLSSLDKLGGVGTSDLDLAGWGIPMIALYYSVIIPSASS